MSLKLKKARCCVGGCNNDDRYPEKYVVRSHVKEMQFFRFTQAKDKHQIWINNIAPGLSGIVSGGMGSYVCANHFVDGEPTRENPHPTLFLSLLKTKFDKSPKKRKPLKRIDANNHSDDSDTDDFNVEVALDTDTALNDEFNMDVVLDTEPESSQTEDSDWDPEISRPDLLLKQVSKAGMITLYTGLPDAET